MKAELITLAVASIAAAASLTGVFLNQLGALNLEQEKWRLAQQDGHRAIVVDFAKELSAAHQRAEWLVWTATNSSDLLSRKDFDSFDTDARASLPRILGYRVLLAAKRPNVYPKLESLLKHYYAADECVGLAGAAFRRNTTEGVKTLSGCRNIVRNVSESMITDFAAAMEAIGQVSSQ